MIIGTKVKIEKTWPMIDKKVEYVGTVVGEIDFYYEVDVHQVYWNDQLAVTWHVKNINAFAKSSIRMVTIET